MTLKLKVTLKFSNFHVNLLYLKLFFSEVKGCFFFTQHICNKFIEIKCSGLDDVWFGRDALCCNLNSP